MDIQALIDRWAREVQGGNKTGIGADYDSEILMLSGLKTRSRNAVQHGATNLR